MASTSEFQCHLCGAKFDWNQNLRRHYTLTHHVNPPENLAGTAERKKECPNCKATFSRLDKHLPLCTKAPTPLSPPKNQPRAKKAHVERPSQPKTVTAVTSSTKQRHRDSPSDAMFALTVSDPVSGPSTSRLTDEDSQIPAILAKIDDFMHIVLPPIISNSEKQHYLLKFEP